MDTDWIGAALPRSIRVHGVRVELVRTARACVNVEVFVVYFSELTLSDRPLAC